MTTQPDQPERPDALEYSLRAVILVIYAAEMVIVIDLATDGALRRRFALAWRRRVTAPMVARRELIKAQRQLIFEAMSVLDRGEPAA